jgi:PAS domain S-box-containing protein
MTHKDGEQAGRPDYPFEEAATARVTLDAHGAVADWNEGAARLLGYPADEVVGRPAAELLAGVQDTEPPSAEAVRWNGTVLLRHRDGRAVPVRLLAHRADADGGPGGGPGGATEGRWLLVSALPQPDPEIRPEDVARWAFTRSPCAVAIYDTALRLLTVNDAMAGVIGLPEDEIRGLRIPEIGGKPQSAELERQMLHVLATGERLDVESFMRTGGEAREHAWSANLTPLTDDHGTVHGVCLTAHDITERYLGRRRLLLVNDASTRIGTTLDITRTAEELAEVCVPHLADFVTVDLYENTAAETGDGEQPPPSPLPSPATDAGEVVLTRAAHRSVTEGCPEATVEPGGTEVYPPDSPHARTLATGRPVIQAVAGPGAHGWPQAGTARADRVRDHGLHSVMAVPIQARGTTLGVAVFYRLRRPEPFVQDDVLLAEEITARAAVCIDNARRFTRERATALSLQRSLLPQSLPSAAAVEVASRYLPAAPHAGIGGDWFDVIPLSGARVGLVVGDVVGHGIQASATMGRLRTAVRTLADVDLSPAAARPTTSRSCWPGPGTSTPPGSAPGTSTPTPPRSPSPAVRPPSGSPRGDWTTWSSPPNSWSANWSPTPSGTPPRPSGSASSTTPPSSSRCPTPAAAPPPTCAAPAPSTKAAAASSSSPSSPSAGAAASTSPARPSGPSRPSLRKVRPVQRSFCSR